MKIYTKTGDKGMTALIGGQRVPKHHIRIECYGTIDELSSWVGLIRDQDISESIKEVLFEIQDRLFTIESLLASDSKNEFNLPGLDESDVKLLEKQIDHMNENLPNLSSFIISGGHTIVSYSHIARTVCRRAERLVLRLSEEYDIDNLVLVYLNRLSDYLFILSRRIGHDLGVSENLWKPRM
ncbi:MAG: cob(I)yrinic acid a,c-diamide adenosyltransferase [Bacteroidales bacterium]|nr:ATP:cob(I)alamin adenosyltransferase [Lentimicrobiaceae bacterium]MDG1136167.1 cob(I)yrinic acid a,c-diamide adenosyltransferase [Bacteroidales bacterium]MDG1901606.1 cob(I)yrinic acid a,c-diamide adenosyltransferase [Bacteroidales bacterium]MDG2081655.1 cob(I)yrinic acid a,c-diamide adenosyltransferase [Bacteroidales bacterium]